MDLGARPLCLSKLELGGECEQIYPGRRRYTAPPLGQQGGRHVSWGGRCRGPGPGARNLERI